MERVVAIKVLPQHALDSPEKVQRFQREVKSAAKLSHPNIVAAYDAHERNGTYFLVMEYVEGDNLQECVGKHGPMSVADAVHVIGQVAAAHQKRMVHRDVKPTNVMLTTDGTAKLLDLGLVRTMRMASAPVQQDLTQDGLAMGTASYMSPEQALDASQADARSDIYSFGCTLYFLLTGCAPFQRNTTVQTIVAHREVDAPRLSDAASEIPSALECCYQRMVAKSPEERFQSIAQLRDELADAKLTSADSRSLLAGVKAQFPGVNALVKAQPVAKASTTRSRQPWIWAVVGVVSCVRLLSLKNLVTSEIDHTPVSQSASIALIANAAR